MSPRAQSFCLFGGPGSSPGLVLLFDFADVVVDLGLVALGRVVCVESSLAIFFDTHKHPSLPYSSREPGVKESPSKTIC